MPKSVVVRIRVLTLFALATLLSTEALACSEATKPYFSGYRPMKPDKPYCLSDYSNTCKSYEIEAYNREVDSYNEAIHLYNMEVNDYITKLKSHIDETVEYAKCEATRVTTDRY